MELGGLGGKSRIGRVEKTVIPHVLVEFSDNVVELVEEVRVANMDLTRRNTNDGASVC